MRNSAIGLAMFFGLAATLSTSRGYAADAGTYVFTVPNFGALAVDVAGNAIAMGEDTFRYRHVNGHWSAQYPLPGGLVGKYEGRAQVAAGRAGMAVMVAYTSGGAGNHLAATIRRTDATWTTPYALDTGLTQGDTGVDVAANADGDYAVSWTGEAHRAYVAVRQRGGTWHRFPMGTIGFGPTQVGIDAYGNVTVARTVRSAEADPLRLVARRKPVSGPAGATFQVSRAGEDVRAFDQIIERTGRQTYAYQSAAAGRVLRQQTVGGPLVQVWSKPAPSMPGIAADGGRLRVVWIERPDPNAPAAVMTQAFNPSAGAPVTITDAPTDPAFAFVAINRYGVGVLAAGTGARLPDTTKVSPVTAGSVGPGDWLDDDGPNPDFMSGAQPVLGAGKQYFIGLYGVYDGPVTETNFFVFDGQLP